MNTVNSTAANYIGVVQKAVTRNTLHQVIDAKQSGNPVDKEQIQASNQEIKDKSIQAGASNYQANMKKQTIDTYVQSTQAAKDSYELESTAAKNSEINSFNAHSVNEARSTVHKRAIGIAVYEQVQSNKEEQ